MPSLTQLIQIYSAELIQIYSAAYSYIVYTEVDLYTQSSVTA